MRIVIDTNILISGVFFGGYPRRIVEAAAAGMPEAFASADILEEYRLIAEAFKGRKLGHFHGELFEAFLNAAQVIEPTEHIEICRDPDDDKFLECASSAKALFVVSGDKDLLVLERYRDIEIVTAKTFCERYLKA